MVEQAISTYPVSAYLKTEGSIEYRECKIAYYTYSMFSTPHKFKINVNVHIQYPRRQIKHTLVTDNVFETEGDAINYGIAEGKKFIDATYETGKVAILHPDDLKTTTKNDKFPDLDKPRVYQQKKGKDKR